MHKLRIIVGISVCLFLSTLLAHSQLTTGTISGTISDPTGATVPGTSVTIKNVETSLSRATVSNLQGRYEATNLPIGKYEVSAAMAGFQTSVRRGIELTVGRHAIVDMALQVGEVAQSITVTGEAAFVETTTATVSNLVDEKRVGELPLNNRDLTQLAYLQPGVLRIPQFGESTPQGGMGEKISVGGSRGTQNVYLLDGVISGDHSGNPQGATSGYTGAETVKEFQVITNNYSAEYRSAAGAIVSAVTKSGTNDFHGSLFEFLRNDNLDATNYFNNAVPGLRKSEFKRNQFGGSLGGPVLRDRTFFFASYEGERERLGSTETVRVPTVAARRGVLPTRTVNVNPAVAPFLELYPVPGQGNSISRELNDGTVQISGPRTQPTNQDFVAVRMDHQFSAGKGGSLSGTYNFDDSDRSPFGVLGDVGAAGAKTTKHILAIRHTSILSPTLLNEFAFGFTINDPQGAIPLTTRDFSNLLFVPTREVLGEIIAGDLTTIGYRQGRRSFNQKSLSFKDGVSLTHGSHSMRFGAELLRYGYNYEIFGQGFAGSYTFNTLETFLTGTPARFQALLPGGDDTRKRLAQIVFGAYAQDNFAVAQSLTLNLGLRYEFATVPKELDGESASLVNFNDSQVTVGPLFTNATLKSFSPRLGFAWTPWDRKTSFRGGAAIFYEFPGLYHIQTSVSSMPPFNLLGDARDTDAIAAGTVLRFPTAYSTQEALLRAQPSIRTMEYNQKNMTTYRWSFTIQRELGSNLIATLGYTGARSLHLWQQSVTNINRWQGWPENPAGPKFWPAITGTNLINPRFNDIRLQSPNANSFHHDLAFGLVKRLSQGLQAQVAYTFSKTIDQFSGLTNSGDNLAQTQRGIYGWDMHLARGLAQFDIRNSLVTNFSYEPSFAANTTGIAGMLAKGWQLNGILTLSDGYPLTVFDERTVQRNRIGNVEALRADLIPGGNANPVLGGPEKYFDVSQFAPSQVGFFGNLGRNTMVAPGYATLDTSVFKNFDFSERSQLQFRAELFNLLNHANFGEPLTSIFTTAGAPNGAAGQITATRTTARQIQFGLRYSF